LWKGATVAHKEQLSHVAFIRTKVEFLERFFSPGEVSAIWIPFPDPQGKSPRRRIVTESFLARYQMVIKEGGLVHLKTDNVDVFIETLEYLRGKKIPIHHAFENIDCPEAKGVPGLDIRTNYEEKFRRDGVPIKYLCFSLPQSLSLPAPRMPFENKDCSEESMG